MPTAKPAEVAAALWPEIAKRFGFQLAGSEGAVKRLVARAVRDAMRAAAERERCRCAKVARAESRRMCRDEDSIQYRVGHKIADVILGESA